MTGRLREARDRLVSAYRAGCSLVLLFDYDGTLTPIVDQPELAKLPRRTRGLLQALSTHPRVIVGIISGRRLDDLKALVGLQHVYYAGTSGLELDLDGRLIIHPEAERGRKIVEAICPTLECLGAAYPGSWVEKKPLGLTLHYRAAARGSGESVRTCAQRLLKPMEGQVRVRDGPMALEITAALGWTKGTAVRKIVEQVEPQPIPLYAGDEANDAEAFTEAIALGGLALAIGPNAPANAEYRLANANSLASFLANLQRTIHPTEE